MDLIKGGGLLVLVGFVSCTLWVLCLGPDNAWPLRKGVRERRDASYWSFVVVMFTLLGLLLGLTTWHIGRELGAPEAVERWAGAVAGICMGVVVAMVAAHGIRSGGVETAAGDKNPIIYWLCLSIMGAVFLAGVAIVAFSAAYGLRIWV